MGKLWRTLMNQHNAKLLKSLFVVIYVFDEIFSRSRIESNEKSI